MSSRLDKLEQATQRDPRVFGFGAMIRDDFALASVGMFHWCATTTELLDLIAECEVSVHVDPDEETYQPLMTELSKARAAARPKDELTEELLKSFAGILSGNARIDWWGSIDDLVSGSGEFAVELREDFRLHLDEDESDKELGSRPIEAEEMDDFVEFLSEYGI